MNLKYSMVYVNRRSFLTMLAAGAAARAAANRQPNIVFVILDDLGSGDLGCYGQRLIRTPHIDALAKQSMRFTSCYAGATVCAPSRAVLMTGLHGGHAPVRANAGTIPILDEDLTVAEVLKAAGYATGGFGKWGLGDAGSSGAPSRQGFDEFFGYLHQTHAHSYYPDFLWDTDKKFLNDKRYSADVIAERSFQFVRKHRDRPFFLYAAYTLPHARFEPPDVEPYGRETWTDGQKKYAAMVTRADHHVGRLLSLLKELKLEENTVVFVTSDNGAHSGEEKGYEFFRSNGSLRGEKGQVYEGGIRVPMIVRWPGRVKAGSTSALPWSFADVMPTLTEIAGGKIPAGIDGISVVPELAGTGKQRQHEYMYWEFVNYDFKTNKLREERMQQAVRSGRWKAVRNPSKPVELYDLVADPGESTDVASKNPEIAARLAKYMDEAHRPARPHNTGSRDWVV